MPEVLQLAAYYERLVAKLEEAEVQLEKQNLEQELVLMAQRGRTWLKSWIVWKRVKETTTTF